MSKFSVTAAHLGGCGSLWLGVAPWGGEAELEPCCFWRWNHSSEFREEEELVIVLLCVFISLGELEYLRS